MTGEIENSYPVLSYRISVQSPIRDHHINIPRRTLQEIFDAIAERQSTLQDQIEELLNELSTSDEKNIRQDGHRIAVDLYKLRRFLQVMRNQLFPEGQSLPRRPVPRRSATAYPCG